MSTSETYIYCIVDASVFATMKMCTRPESQSHHQSGVLDSLLPGTDSLLAPQSNDYWH